MRFKFRGAKMNDGEVRLAKWWTTEGDIKHMSTQDAKDRQRQRQSGKSMGEFGENYSYRKRYQHDYHDSSGGEWVEPNITPQGKPIKYDPYVIEPFIVPEKEMLESIPTGRDPLDARKQSQLKFMLQYPVQKYKPLNRAGPEKCEQEDEEPVKKDLLKGLI